MSEAQLSWINSSSSQSLEGQGSQATTSNINQKPQQQYSWYKQQPAQKPQQFQPQFSYGYPQDQYNFDNEPPLLEELGIDVAGILKRIRAMLFFNVKSQAFQEVDLAGPLFFIMILATLHLLKGRLHYGVLLGWTVLGSCFIYFVASQMAGYHHPQRQHLTIYSITCMFGYCLFPMVALGVLQLLVPKGKIQMGINFVGATWCAALNALLIQNRNPPLQEHGYLLFYPSWMVYLMFGLICVY